MKKILIVIATLFLLASCEDEVVKTVDFADTEWVSSGARYRESPASRPVPLDTYILQFTQNNKFVKVCKFAQEEVSGVWSFDAPYLYLKSTSTSDILMLTKDDRKLISLTTQREYTRIR